MINQNLNSEDLHKKISKILETRRKKFIPGKSRIKYADFQFGEEEIKSSINALLFSFEKNWFAVGNNTSKFQKKLASYLGLKGTIFVNSGSSANLISVATLVAKNKIKRGDEFVTLATTFPTTINPALIYGLKPVVIDIELPSYTANLHDLEKAITKKTKLIMLPHINGSPHNMKRVIEIANRHGLYVIEDCCDAFGSKFDGRFVGTFGDMGTYSFYAAHHMSTGEGGAVGSKNNDFLTTAESIRDWGRAPIKRTSDKTKRKLSFQKLSHKLPEDYEQRYTYSEIGYNLKPLDLQSVIGLVQLRKISYFIRQRRRNFEFLKNKLEKLENKIILPEGLPGAQPSWFVFPITIRENSGVNREKMVRFLESKNIDTRPLLAGNIINHPAYSGIKFRKIGKLANSNLVLKNSFIIGIHPGLNSVMLEYMIKCLKKFLK